ncbi:MAG: hypothetical protein MJ174_07505 [Treponema sp.]|nr:hypothetical protein [Treponema sp.]
MTMQEIDNEVHNLFLKLTSKIKNYDPGRNQHPEIVNQCLDLYFKLKEESKPKQLELWE